jgi:hypothetical protein
MWNNHLPLHNIQIGSRDHPAANQMGTEGFIHDIKRLEHEADR